MGIAKIAMVAGTVCGLAMGIAPSAHATGGPVLSGTYNVVGPNSTIDQWVITPQCAEATVGCQSVVHSPLLDGQAVYKGANTWIMTLQGLVPVCPDRSSTFGAMIFQWNSQSLDGQLVSVQRGKCQMTRPGQDQLAFKLVKATG